MDDRNRKYAEDGLRGVEGGVSERTKETKPKTPEQPKEIPDLPHSEKEKLKETVDEEKDAVVADTKKKPYAVSISTPVI